MKMVGIGDLFIPSEYIQKGTEVFRENGIEVTTVDWELADFDELQHINLLVEQGGREDYVVPDNVIEAVKDADIILTQFCPINRQVLEAAKKLKYIGRINPHAAYLIEQELKKQKAS